jgi:rubrerythrin
VASEVKGGVAMDSHANPRRSTFAIYDEALRARLCAVALATVKDEEEKEGGDTRLFLCPACGHIEPNQPPASCPICAARPEQFVQV